MGQNFLFSLLASFVFLVGSCTPTSFRDLAQVREPRSLSQLKWAINLSSGSDIPPQGTRSLFDQVFMEGDKYVPLYPFTKLRERIDKVLGAPGGYQQVLIPKGRSLQRNVAKKITDGFYKFPRVVLAVTQNPLAVDNPKSEYVVQPNTQNRIYFGFAEPAKRVEVISYNELAGRFEFQEIINYGLNNMKVQPASRNLCLGCHQNQAPLFSRRDTIFRQWSETNSNPKISNLIAAQHKEKCEGESCYLGIPIYESPDVPEAIDAATDDATNILVWQRLWKDGCEGDSITSALSTANNIFDRYTCRGRALEAMLKYQLIQNFGDSDAKGERLEASPRLVSGFVNMQRETWQKFNLALKMPNSDIPNRDPLEPDFDKQCDLVAAKQIFGEAYDHTRESNPASSFKVIKKDEQELVDELQSSDGVVVHPLCDPLSRRGPKQEKRIFEVDTKNLAAALEELSSFFTPDDMKALKRGFHKKLVDIKASDKENISQYLALTTQMIDSIIIDARNGQPAAQKILGRNVFSRELSLKVIFDKLNFLIRLSPTSLNAFSINIDTDTNSSVIPNDLANVSKFSYLKPFYKYCSQCHLDRPEPVSFLGSNLMDINAKYTFVSRKIYMCSEEILARLNKDVAAQKMPQSIIFDGDDGLEQDFMKDYPQILAGILWNLAEKHYDELDKKYPALFQSADRETNKLSVSHFLSEQYFRPHFHEPLIESPRLKGCTEKLEKYLEK